MIHHRLARLIALADAADRGLVKTVDVTGWPDDRVMAALTDLDVVVLVEPITEDWVTPTGTVKRTVPAGTIGAIVATYPDGSREVEFPTTTARVTAGQIRPVERRE
ncbi:hypothetical protein BRX37_16700 [Sphingomonas sp. S-NIH.Pt3_0716]|nr:hypothetical protein BRX37_16700 [Sphingomonas sp. S-NIH.Pt3_0716]